MCIHGIYPDEVTAADPLKEKGRTICGRLADDLVTIEVKGYDDEYGLGRGPRAEIVTGPGRPITGTSFLRCAKRSVSMRREAAPSLLVAAAPSRGGYPRAN